MTTGYIGLGAMGSALATRLQQSHALTVYDLSAEAVAKLTACGAKPAETLAEVAKACDVIFLCLPKSEHVAEVLFGSQGLAPHLRPGTVIIDQTSGDPAQTRSFAARLAAQQVDLLDAPVSGGTPAALAGTIAIMASGQAETFAKMEKLLHAISPNTFYCGAVGSGQVMKIVNNMISTSVRMATLEGVALAMRNGLDLGVITDVLNSGGAQSRVTQKLLPSIIAGVPDSFFYLELMLKDLNLASKLGVETGVPIYYGQLTRNMLQLGHNTLGAGANYYDITKVVAQYSGISFPQSPK